MSAVQSLCVSQGTTVTESEAAESECRESIFTEELDLSSIHSSPSVPSMNKV